MAIIRWACSLKNEYGREKGMLDETNLECGLTGKRGVYEAIR